jgi:hypothetical protein
MCCNIYVWLCCVSCFDGSETTIPRIAETTVPPVKETNSPIIETTVPFIKETTVPTIKETTIHAIKETTVRTTQIERAIPTIEARHIYPWTVVSVK